MKEKKVTITAKGASIKQWSDLMLHHSDAMPFSLDLTLALNQTTV